MCKEGSRQVSTAVHAQKVRSARSGVARRRGSTCCVPACGRMPPPPPPPLLPSPLLPPLLPPPLRLLPALLPLLPGVHCPRPTYPPHPAHLEVGLQGRDAGRVHPQHLVRLPHLSIKRLVGGQDLWQRDHGGQARGFNGEALLRALLVTSDAATVAGL